jgi:hypothetical protein
MKQKNRAIQCTAQWLLFGMLMLGMPWATDSVCAQEDDALRRIWNKKFIEERQKNARATKSPGRARRRSAKAATISSIPPAASPAAGGRIEGELIGVTLWRLVEAPARADGEAPRLRLPQRAGGVREWVAERVVADTAFDPEQRVRLGIEAPREKSGYLYVIDREVYADGTMSAPYLIFPSQRTPEGGNRVEAGKLVYVPAPGDPVPYFNIQRSRQDQVSELLTIIVTPEPLDVQPGPPDAPAELDPARVTNWEQQWGGRTERRELSGGAGKAWTRGEQQAGEGKRKLLQRDPLPQTVYFVAGKRRDHTLIQVPLRIAP